MASDPAHLVERLAVRLRGVGGLQASTPPAEPANGMRPGDAQTHGELGDGGEGLKVDRAASETDRTSDTMALHGQHGAPRPAPPGAANFPTGQGYETRPRQQTGLVDTMPHADLLVPYTLDLNALERAGLVVGRKLRTRISEEFRITVGTILRSIKSSYTPGRGAGNLLMVTSARPGEGKSFTTLNLAGSIAQHTQREVLMVDVDAKQQSMSDLLGVGDRPGLIDLALNPASRIEDYIVPTAIANLAVLPVGIRRTEAGDSAEGTVARPITAMIERLGRRFPNHLIILDAPPCLSTSDPSTLATFVGQVVLVVEAEKTQRAEILASLDLLKACPTVTLLLNKIRVTTSYTFGAYHYFGSYS